MGDMRRVRTETTGTRHLSIRRASTWLLAGLLRPVALAACGSGGKSNGTDAPGQDKDTARKFAQCMRDNGVPDFPDPDAKGEFRGQGHERQNDPKFAAANEKCRSLAPGSEHEKTGDP